MSIESVLPSNHFILCHPLLLPPSIFPSIRVFSNELTKASELWFSFSPSNEYSELVSFRTDWFHSLQSKGLLQHHSSKASILRFSSLFTVQLSHPYMTLGKTISLAIWTFAGKVISLLFNMLSTLAIAFIARSKCLLISWLQSPSAVILGTVSTSICLKWWDPMPWS